MQAKTPSRTPYERRQFGWVIFFAMCVITGLLFALGGVKGTGEASPFTGIAFFVLIVLSLFMSMTVRVTDRELIWWMGSIRGLGKTIPLQEIQSVEPIKTRVWEGWGIHLTVHGWLWNVSGFNAVEITLKNGTRYALGTPEPKELARTVMRARKKAGKTKAGDGS